MPISDEPEKSVTHRAAETFGVALKLGLTSFGGPIAHIGYFERTYVEQLRWLTREQFVGLLAMCQILPGPTSSQVGFAIGLHRGGWRGALAAWLGFTLPSAVLMFVCALLAADLHGKIAAACLHGLQIVAVAVVAQAAWNMARTLCPDAPTRVIAAAAACLLLAVGRPGVQIGALLAGAAAGIVWCRRPRAESADPVLPISSRVAWTALGTFVALLLGLGAMAVLMPRSAVALADIFYRAGALVFGGGHVVLPLLRDAMVPQGWISDEHFLAGYGLAQALPGPLFTLSAYLGAANGYVQPAAWGALIGIIFIFLPGLLLTVAGAALWSRASRHANVRNALAGINAAVVGILAAALYDPIWKTAIHAPLDAAIALAGLLLLARWRVPPMVVVVFSVACSLLIALT
jgi:chromate transporter